MNPSAPVKRLKARPNCKICQAIAIDPRLKVRIYATTYYNENGTESLRDVARDYDGAFTQAGLSNHCRKHQLGARKNVRNNKLAVMRAAMDRDGQMARQLQETGRVSVIPKENYEQVWDTVLELGMERVVKGELKVSGNMLLKVAKDKADYQNRSRDRNIEVAKMMYNFASGEQTDLIEEGSLEPTTAITAESHSGRPDGPGGLYYPAPGNAAASGPDSLYSPND